MGAAEKAVMISGVLLAVGAGAAGALLPGRFPAWENFIFRGGIFLSLIGIGLVAWAFFHEGNSKMTEEARGPLVGLDINNKDGGVGAEIVSGSATSPSSIGAQVHVPVVQGQGTIGVRVIQSGPGVGMRIIQNGPGTGLHISVGGKPEKKEP